MRRLTGILAAAAVAVAGAAGASRTAADPWSGWTRLTFEARKILFFYGQVDMVLRDQGGRRTLETRTRATFLGAELARSRSLTTIDTTTGRTLEFHELSRKRGRRYVFGEAGYTVERLVPSNGPDAPLSEWSVTSKRSFPYPPATGPAGAPRVFDYYGMILHLRETKLEKPGDEVVIHVATSHGVEPYRVRVGQERASQRQFRDIASGAMRTVPVRELRLRIQPVDPAQAEEGFLRMEGETEIWVEAGSRTLLEIDGEIPRIPGRVEIGLAALG